MAAKCLLPYLTQRERIIFHQVSLLCFFLSMFCPCHGVFFPFSRARLVWFVELDQKVGIGRVIHLERSTEIACLTTSLWPKWTRVLHVHKVNSKIPMSYFIGVVLMLLRTCVLTRYVKWLLTRYASSSSRIMVVRLSRKK